MFLFFFHNVLNSEPKWFLAVLFIGLFIVHLNHTVNNLDRFVFWEYPNRYPNRVAHLATQCFEVTRSSVSCEKSSLTNMLVPFSFLQFFRIFSLSLKFSRRQMIVLGWSFLLFFVFFFYSVGSFYDNFVFNV